MIEAGSIATRLVPGPVQYQVLLPDDLGAETGSSLPLLLCLHGGLGGHDLLSQLGPVVQAMWRSASLPNVAVAVPQAGRSLYLDYRDGSQKWETFLITEFLPCIQARYGVLRSREGTLVCGVSMGGLGALRLGLKHPDIFGGIVAWEPNIEPALAWSDVRPEDRFWRTDEMLQARFGCPLDEAYWAANNPATIVTMQADALRVADLPIYLEIGSDDAYGLHRGVEFLHRALYDRGLRHEYRYVRGADHIGRTIEPRLQDGLAFAARILRREPPDPRVEQLRDLVVMQKRRAGLVD